jgi:hypothetical protein
MRTLFLVGLTVLTVSCVGPAAAETGKGRPEPAATPVVVSVPSAATFSSEQVTAVAENTFPLVQPYGYYSVCGVTGDSTACPYTARLKARLSQLRAALIPAQNPSPTRAVNAEITGPGSAVAHVQLFNGQQRLDLQIVVVDGRVLVDDESCTGRPETSIYATLVAC